MRLCLAVILCLLASSPQARAAEAQLTLQSGKAAKTYTAEKLLENPAARDIDIPADPSYAAKMHYRALPLATVLKDMALPAGDVLEAVANDGFAAMLPADLVLRAPADKGAVPYLAVEPPAKPWPKLPGKDMSAGPFYIVWLRPEKDGIRTEQWPYAVVTLRAAASPAARWPALALAKTLAADSPVRAGQALFVTNCMTCHKMNGAGDADVGPDLNLPESPVEYFRKDALAAYIRDPSSLRRWKAMGMKGFGKDALSDREVGEIIAYLEYMARRKAAAPVTSPSP